VSGSRDKNINLIFIPTSHTWKFMEKDRASRKGWESFFYIPRGSKEPWIVSLYEEPDVDMQHGHEHAAST
jgi:hypothetical protein